MKISNYKKKKGSIYEVTLSNQEKICLYDEVILKYGLLLSKEIEESKLAEIIQYNSYVESYYIALKFLSTKLRTEKEIIKRLNGFSKEAIQYTLNKLKNEGYLDSNLYIKSYVNDAINLKLVGPNKIVFELIKLGFKENEINNYLNNFSKDIWYDKINKYITKKISSNHNLSGLGLKNKLMQDLITKGFLKEDINFIIKEYNFNDNKEIYEKEYNKLKTKLSKKYEGEELEYRIKMKLRQKGFNFNT